MTETTACTLDLSEPRLAPLRQDELAALLVDVDTGTILRATAACQRLGISPDAPLPPLFEDIVRGVRNGDSPPPVLVRVRLTGSLNAQLFRCMLLALSGGPAVLFADPTAFEDAPTLETEARVRAFVPRESAPELDEPAERFTFETDETDRLRLLSPALAAALGSAASEWLGASFPELAAAGQIVSGAAVAAALARGASFSGVRVTVPSPTAVELELGGVPLFDATRRRVGTRGFGILRRGSIAGRASRPGGAAPAPLPPMAVPGEPQEPPAGNVVPFGNPLSPRDAKTFEDIGRALTDYIGRGAPNPPGVDAASEPTLAHEVLDALPMATLLADDDHLAHANRTFFQWTGWPDLAAVEAAGGLDHALQTNPEGDASLMTATGELLPVSARTLTAPFLSPDARLHVLRRLDDDRLAGRPSRDAEEGRRRTLDLVPWPVLLLDGKYNIRFANRAASVQIGFPAADLEGEPFTVAVAPAHRADAVGWLDHAAEFEDAQTPTALPLRLRARDGDEFAALAGLARITRTPPEFCLVLAPADSVADGAPGDQDPIELPRLSLSAAASEPVTSETPAADPTALPDRDAPAGEAEPVADVLELQPVEPAPEVVEIVEAPPVVIEAKDSGAAVIAGETAEAALRRVARRLAESLAPAFQTLSRPAEDMDAALPDDVRTALDAVQQCVGDISALAAPLGEMPQELTAPGAIVDAAVDHLLPAARRRRVTLRTDMDDVPDVTTSPPRLARLVRLMLEEALLGAPAATTLIVSLSCEDPEGTTPICLQVSDPGAAVDEVDDAAARAPLLPSPGTDRFSRAGRPLRLARLVAEADALGGQFEIVRGRDAGMTARLSLPR